MTEPTSPRPLARPMAPSTRFGWRSRALAVGALVTGASFLGVPAWSAERAAGDYATWDDVVAAQNDVSRQQSLISDINSQINGLNARLGTANADADVAGRPLADAIDRVAERRADADSLRAQAEAASSSASTSREQAGQLAAAMVNRSGGDPTLSLFMQPEEAENLLSQLNTLSSLSEQTDGIYNQALAEQATAEQLAKQADDAAAELAVAEAEAQTRFDEAAAIQTAIQTETTSAISQRAELQAMLAPLEQHRTVVQSDYQAGQRIVAEQAEAERVAREQAAVVVQQASHETAVAEAEAAGLPAPEAPASLSDPSLLRGAPSEAISVDPATGDAFAAPMGEPVVITVPPAGAEVPSAADSEPEQSATETGQGTAGAAAPAAQPAAPAETPSPEPSSEPAAAPEPAAPVAAAPAPGAAAPAPAAPEAPAATSAPDLPTAAPAEPVEPVPPVQPEQPAPQTPQPETQQPAAPAITPGYGRPMEGAYISDYFGMRWHPVWNDYRMHNGLDLYVPGGTCGAPLYAASNGVITYAGAMGGYGNVVTIDIGGGASVSYAHMLHGGIAVGIGQNVSAGELVGFAGTTGTSTGCHLHFELSYFGSLMDPLPWLDSVGIHYTE